MSPSFCSLAWLNVSATTSTQSDCCLRLQSELLACLPPPTRELSLHSRGALFITRHGLRCRYLRLDPARAAALMIDRGGPVPESLTAAAWDAALDRASAVYGRRMYNFFADNCHCYVAMFMNNVRRRCDQGAALGPLPCIQMHVKALQLSPLLWCALQLNASCSCHVRLICVAPRVCALCCLYLSGGRGALTRSACTTVLSARMMRTRG